MTLQQPEVDVVREIAKGNAIAFQQIFNAHYESLCHYAWTILKDSDEVEDIVQSMFVKIWEKREELDIKIAIRSYLFKAVYHQCINHLEHLAVRQKHKVHTTFELQSEIQMPEAFQNELEENIVAAINGLPKQCRLIFRMSRYDELKYAEIATQLNISVNTVENQISKALKILRTKLRDTEV